jgi:hypothetical protein
MAWDSPVVAGFSLVTWQCKAFAALCPLTSIAEIDLLQKITFDAWNTREQKFRRPLRWFVDISEFQALCWSALLIRALALEVRLLHHVFILIHVCVNEILQRKHLCENVRKNSPESASCIERFKEAVFLFSCENIWSILESSKLGVFYVHCVQWAWTWQRLLSDRWRVLFQ